MAKLYVLVLLAMSLDMCSTRPSPKGKKGGCLPGQKTPTFKMISLNADVTLPCPFKGKSITFLRHCIPLKVGAAQSTTSTNKSKITVSGNTLTINKFVTMDSGKYTCQSTAANGQVKEFNWVVHIKFNHKNKANSTADYREEPVESNVVIDCRRFVGQNIFFSQMNGQSVTRVPNSRLYKNISPKMHELFDLTIHDTGFYYCGNSDLALHLVVRELPKVTINGKSVVKPGNDVQFECDYTGSQKTAWFKEQERISESNKQGKSNVKTSVKNLGYNKQSLKLNLTNVSVSDSGRYRCSVEFDNTRVFSTDIKLTVFAFLNMFGMYGNYNTPKQSALFNCRASDENATYLLLKKPLDNKDKHPYKIVKSARKMFPGFFTIPSVSSADEGYYKCVATSQGVSIEREFDDPIWLSTS